MASSVFSNPIGWAQFRLLGGWPNLISTTGAYAIVLGGLMFALAHGLHAPPARTYELFVGLFLGIQVLIALVYGAGRVSAAIRGDMSSRLIESHRLMPVPPMQAVLGYLFGAPFQAFLVYGVNYVLGAMAVSAIGMRQQSWLFSNVILLIFCVFLWTIIAFFSFRTNWAIGLFIFAFFAMLFLRFEPLVMLPGLNVLMSPMISNTIFDMKTGLTIDWPFAVAVAAQFFIALMYCFGAARRYRRDDDLGFTPAMGLVLLGVWVAAGAMQMLYPEDFAVRGFGRLGENWSTEFIIAILSCMLLAILPIASATRLAVLPPRNRTMRHLKPWYAVVLAFAVVMAVSVAAPARLLLKSNVVATAIVVAGVLVSARYILEIAYRLKLWPRRTMFLWLLLTWCVPLMLELVRQALLEEDPLNPKGPPMSLLGLCSPIGALVKIWGPDQQDVSTGVIIQAAVALAAAVAVYALLRPSARVSRATTASGTS